MTKALCVLVHYAALYKHKFLRNYQQSYDGALLRSVLCIFVIYFLLKIWQYLSALIVRMFTFLSCLHTRQKCQIPSTYQTKLNFVYCFTRTIYSCLGERQCKKAGEPWDCLAGFGLLMSFVHNKIHFLLHLPENFLWDHKSYLRPSTVGFPMHEADVGRPKFPLSGKSVKYLNLCGHNVCWK